MLTLKQRYSTKYIPTVGILLYPFGLYWGTPVTPSPPPLCKHCEGGRACIRVSISLTPSSSSPALLLWICTWVPSSRPSPYQLGKNTILTSFVPLTQSFTSLSLFPRRIVLSCYSFHFFLPLLFCTIFSCYFSSCFIFIFFSLHHCYSTVVCRGPRFMMYIMIRQRHYTSVTDLTITNNEEKNATIFKIRNMSFQNGLTAFSPNTIETKSVGKWHREIIALFRDL